MNLANELLLGSSRVDQWRKEITTMISMVLGFLTDDDCVALDLKGETVLAEGTNHRWVVWYHPRKGLQFRLFYLMEGKVKDVACELPGNRISLEYVGLVHSCLDSFVKGIQKLVPDLNDRWRGLLHIARYEFCIYYKLQFHVDSKHPLYEELAEGCVSFQKKSDLSFPLPLRTRVFVGLAGELNLDEKLKPADGEQSCFFKVVEHEHHVGDYYGDLSERQLTMILKPCKNWEGAAEEKNFARLLEANGWEKVF